MTSVDTAPDLQGDDSYRVATDTVIPDDNLTVNISRFLVFSLFGE